MWSLNLGSPAAVPRLSEAMAIELGANLLGESIIFVTAAAILVFEYQRSSRKETEKQQQLQVRSNRHQIQLNIHNLIWKLCHSFLAQYCYLFGFKIPNISLHIWNFRVITCDTRKHHFCLFFDIAEF